MQFIQTDINPFNEDPEKNSGIENGSVAVYPELSQSTFRPVHSVTACSQYSHTVEPECTWVK